MPRKAGFEGRRARGLIVLTASIALSPLATTPGCAQVQEDTLALVGARIHPAPDGMPIFDGVVVVAGGKIETVGARNVVKVPDGTRTLDCTGLVITAGFQNSHVHLGAALLEQSI
jgi:predicted amidohydrolase YtcJ